MNTDDLIKLCSEWQTILRLQDWNVKCEIKRANDMLLKDVAGECNWDINSKVAAISILDPIDYPSDHLEQQDIEKTLVHELLHLHYAPFDQFENDSPEIVNIEQSINLISEALVNLRRK
ncbi:hypothetical protein NRS6110_04448 [Bacillus subtilis]|uniref:hypothetical protein n=1 Tax=Bacillus subtilis TaxID=1423 RepID=UPI000E2EA804|nr:hypothetical protein [Bacillus subtilis]MDK8209063.1 hypothetical protein [Bacillus subtilis]MDK8209104.1 hypothetical protein [Bacillus subtilis]CAF1787884.1 hypothetical protein NRS6110_04448 [Bacillus subtilis]